MGRKTFSAPIKVVGTANTTTVLEVATSGDSQTAGTAVFQANGDLVSQNVGGQKVWLGPWGEVNIAANLTTATAQLLLNVADQTEICPGYAGSIIGVAACLNANITAGTLQVCASVNGNTVFSAVNAATTVRTIVGTQNKDIDTFAATDRIGVKIVTNAGFLPTTADGTFSVIVEI